MVRIGRCSPFPLVSPWYHINHIGIKNAWRIGGIKNKWDRDIELKKAIGVPQSVFTRNVGRINSLLNLNKD